MKNKSVLTSLLPAIVTIILFGGLLTPAFGEESYLDQLKHYVFLTPTSVVSPIGYWLLIRKDNTTCAIRFTDFQMFGGSTFTNYSGSPNEGSVRTETNSYAEYDFFSQNDGSGDFKKNNMVLGHNKIAKATGTWESSDDLTGCGALSLKWAGTPLQPAGTGVVFYTAEPREEGIELAPTKWRDASEINIKDPRIKWYRYDKTRKHTRTPIENLW
ncbi:MAG: hypothetical protein ABL880_01125 [Methylotenera sp.]